MTFAQRRNRLTTHYSDGISVVKQRISALNQQNIQTCSVDISITVSH